MPDRHSKNAAHVIISTTFVSLLAVPAVGPALSAVQIEFDIHNRDIGWMLMSSYTLPALLLVPVTGYLADRFGKKHIPVKYTHKTQPAKREVLVTVVAV